MDCVVQFHKIRLVGQKLICIGNLWLRPTAFYSDKNKTLYCFNQIYK